MNLNSLEIERKYLIAMPELDWLEENGRGSDIVQTYLAGGVSGKSERVRARSSSYGTVYTHTIKRHITDMSREEQEREISLEEYKALLQRRDTQRRVIEKRRYVLPYRGQNFEIDIYPFWQDKAIMEIEMESESDLVELPPQVQVIREVTDDKRYTNAALARALPED